MRNSESITNGMIGCLFFLLLLVPVLLQAGDNWPKEIKSGNASIIIYQPQSDSMDGDHLFSRAAISITTPKMKNPVFGAIWTDSKFSTDRSTGTCTISNVKVLNARFPGIDTVDKAKVQELKRLVEENASGWNIEFSLEELKADLAGNQAAVKETESFKNDPPQIIYVKQPSILVLFDGDPVFKVIENAGVKRAINTPFLVLLDEKDKFYYLFGGEYWYKTSDPVKNTWANVASPSQGVMKYFEALQKEMAKSGNSQQAKKADSKSAVPKIVVATKPTELLQSKGEPQYAPIQGTGLLYMTNTENNIFMTIDKNQYYVLLSGRWYLASKLEGPWSFVDAEKLPPDFAKIPEGSAKDIVLASVPGTQAAKEAVMDAQIPQTAAVDRKTAKCEVKYDGDPKFEKIQGTDIARGMNTSSTVLLYMNVYYVCDNAVWFIGKTPTGPWDVATSVPDAFKKIPPDDPSYNVKYVYIYDVTPDVVYVGYTPGYVGCYVYGPTVVYGTGYPYPPFYGPYYYPRPVTFGFSMNYNPWYGWSMGFSMSYGMFTFSVGGPVGYHGGWWGPPMYRPPMPPPYGHYYGPRPPAPVYRGGGNTININNSNNIYVNRGDKSTRPAQQPSVSQRPAQGDRTPGTRPSQQPAGGNRVDRTGGAKPSTQPANKAGGANNVFTDKSGNVYRNNNGDWQKNNGKNWESAQPKQQDVNRQPNAGQNNKMSQPKTQDRSNNFNKQEMDRQNSTRQRGTQNSNNRSSIQRSSAGSGGGARTGGGGAGGRRR